MDCDVDPLDYDTEDKHSLDGIDVEDVYMVLFCNLLRRNANLWKKELFQFITRSILILFISYHSTSDRRLELFHFLD